jgi:phosphoribosylglycinamide formyltransferase-1
MKNIVIFASGSGSNAENIVKYFQNNPHVSVPLILANKPDAYVLERANKLSISTYIFSREIFYQTDEVLNKLLEVRTDLVVLAGFLWLVPDNILKHFPNKIINIHPALLPKYGGKGMYGIRVHETVRESGDKESGISIHYVNERYDEGEIIFQAKCPVEDHDTPESIAQKVHALEYKYFPIVIEKLLQEGGKRLKGFDASIV